MNTRVRLNLYERNIVTSLVEDFNLKPNNARDLVVQYIKIIRKLGGYDSCEQHAKRLIKAQNNGYTPDVWLKRILKIEREEMRDKGIPEREVKSEYVHI